MSGEFNHLSINTRRVVLSLCKGNTARIGKKNLNILDDQSKNLLAVLSINLDSLRRQKGGAELVDKTISLNSSFDLINIAEELANYTEANQEVKTKRFKLKKVKTYSFRGLAPAGKEWLYDFKEKSHLIYGPNGSGKSSLLGAICWCLTGILFRDDCPPCEPEIIHSYPVGEVAEKIDRDVAQSLIDENGKSSSASVTYWVEVQLVGNDTSGKTEMVYLRRSSDEGLSWSTDGNNWLSIKQLTEAGIDDLDSELRLLVPAKISHTQFGKNPDLVRLLADIAGYGDLEAIADIAADVVSSAKRNKTDIEKKELSPIKEVISQAVTKITDTADVTTKGLPSYIKICQENRTKEDIQGFGEDIKRQIEDATTQLAKDLEITIPEKTNIEKYKKWQEQSINLPGQVTTLLFELDKPIKENFNNSIGFITPTTEDLIKLETSLAVFEKEAGEKIGEHIEWINKEKEKRKLGLMLRASELFDNEQNVCPVCTQSLKNVPHITKELNGLKAFSKKDHLQQRTGDFERYLIAELDKKIPLNKRAEGMKCLSDRILEDWQTFKKRYCKELALSVAEKFDSHIKSVADNVKQKEISPFNISYEEGKEILDFSSFTAELDNAKKYIEMCKCIHRNEKDVVLLLGHVLCDSEDRDGEFSLKKTLTKTKDNNEKLKELSTIVAEAKILWLNIKKLEEVKTKIFDRSKLVDSAEPLKKIKDVIRSEVKEMVQGELGRKTKEYYEKLYDNEVLQYEQLTTGHAANPDIKDEINLYLRAGNHIVPMGPFSNAGRMRALLLSFAFALLEKSSCSLNFIILDDPALSLDDEHKARFVDNLIEPLIKAGQVILGTHYQRFYEDSEYAFNDSIKLQMIPRRRSSDQVSFEASDLLERVEDALGKNSGNWREVAGNIRTWIERTLATLSGYCPEPFLADGISPSLDNYGKITHPSIATDNRTKIISVLRGRKLERVVDPLHHNESIERPDVADAFKQVNECRRIVNAEIENFKVSYNHALKNRGIHGPEFEKSIIFDVGSFKDRINKRISVVREAAAAHNREGIEWEVCEEYSIEGCQVVQVCSDVISPIALNGQYLLLDWEGREPKNKDLVVVETPDNHKLVRRIWFEEDGAIILEGANPTEPFKPIRIITGKCKMHRIVGVLYNNQPLTIADGSEWSLRGVNDSWFEDVIGVKVKGTSMEPVARNGQIILVKTQDIKQKIANDMLACISIKDIGEVIKRCYIQNLKCVLCAINPNEREVPIVVDLASIQQAYELKGVLFKVDSGISA